MKQPKNSLQSYKFVRSQHKIANKLKTSASGVVNTILFVMQRLAPGEINLQSKQDLICHVAKVKVATSTHSMADVIPFQRIYYLIPANRKFPQHQKKIYFTHNKKNNIHYTVRVSMSQKLLANKHLRLPDSRLSLVQPSGGLGVLT